MTAEQARQYEICKTRRHEEYTTDTRSAPWTNQMAATQATPWKTCRWCGTQFQDVPEIKQVEKT